MSDKPTPEETAAWQRRLAAQANNRAWTLAERPSRSAAEDQEMLHAAHAAMHLWAIVGNEKNVAHAAQLLAHVHAFLGQAGTARAYLAQSAPLLASALAEPWERAFAHAVAAHVASAGGDAAGHRAHHLQAVALTAALPHPQDRAVLEATLRVLPAPAP